MRAAPQRGLVVAGLVALGLMLDVVSIPPGPLPLLVLAADVPFLWLIGGRVTKRWRLAAFGYGFLHFAFALRWLAQIHWIQILGSGVVLAFAYLFAAMAIRMFTRRGVPYLLVVPTVFVFEEIFRTFWFGGMPWPARSLSFAAFPGAFGEELVASSAYLGAYALSFAAAFSSAVLARFAPRLALSYVAVAPRRPVWGVALLAILVLQGLSMLGSRHMATVASERDARGESVEATPRPLIAIQGNIPQSLKHSTDPDAEMRMYEAHLDLTREALGDAQARGEAPIAVLWPETMVPWVFTSTALAHRFPDTWENELRVMSHIRRVATRAPEDTRFLLGAVYHFRRGEERHGRLGAYGTHDSLLVVDARKIPFRGADEGPKPPPPPGEVAPWVLARHDKHVLVPGGEYTPMGDVIPPLRRFRDLVSVIPPLDPGREHQPPFPLEGGDREGAPALSVGTVICFELLFPARCRAWRRHGANVLLNPSNYGWFGPTGFRAQIAAAAALRAAETGTTVVMAGNTGPTGFWDPLGRPYGRFVAMGGGVVRPTGAIPTTFREGWASGELETTAVVPLYVLVGDAPWFGLGGVLFLLLLLRRRRG